MNGVTKPVEEAIWIPDVPEDRIRELAKRIKPVVRFSISLPGGFLFYPDGIPFYIRKVDLFDIAYTWSPKPRWPATRLTPLQDITTYHSWGHYSLFKPSIAEVLAQIPANLLDRVVAFEIIKQPETADDLNQNIEAMHAGFHVATTRLYART